ncbi:MAG: TolC family protein [Bacteroidaceae bacterium]|nr:TolC family protein [Bacteroidaceae bacterium]
MNKIRLYLGIAALGTVMFTTSCASLRAYRDNAKGLRSAYERPTDIQTDNLYGTTVNATDDGSLATLSWRELYTDPCLQSLIETALTKNTDIKVQEWAIEQAKQSREMSKKAFLPSLDFNPSVGYSYTFNKDIKGNFAYNIPLALNWEIDAFGTLRNEKRMAESNLLMQEDVQQAIKSRLVANIASLYYQLQALDQTKLLSEEASAVWADMINASEIMMKNGVADAISVSQFKAQQYEIEATMKDIEHNINQIELNICALLGETPHKIQRGSLLATASPAMLRTGLSSELLANRPDVRQAERNLEYFYYNEKVARSNFYPKFNINAGAAFNGNFVLSALGSIAMPIFARGKIKAQHEISKAQFEQAKLTFQQKLIDAGSEVMLSLSRCTSSSAKTESRMKQIKEYETAVEYSRIQMSNGQATYLDVLTAQTNLFQKKQNVIDERLEEMLGLVNLYLALGGGGK